MSIPLYAFINFSVILLLSPPKPLTERFFISARELVLYFLSTFVIAFFALPVIKGFISDEEKGDNNETEKK